MVRVCPTDPRRSRIKGFQIQTQVLALSDRCSTDNVILLPVPASHLRARGALGERAWVIEDGLGRGKTRLSNFCAARVPNAIQSESVLPEYCICYIFRTISFSLRD